MTQFTQNGTRYLAVEVSHSAEYFKVQMDDDVLPKLFFKQDFMTFTSIGSLIHLPDGNWSILGTISSTENLHKEVCREMVDAYEFPFSEGHYCYPDYHVYEKTGFKAFDTAQDSLITRLESLGLESKLKRYLILKEI